MAALQADILELTQRVEQAVADKLQFQAQHLTPRSELVLSSAEYVSLQSRLEQTESALRQLRDDSAKLQKEYFDYQEKLEWTRADLSKRAKGEVSALEAKTAELEGLVVRLEQKLQDAEQQLATSRLGAPLLEELRQAIQLRDDELSRLRKEGGAAGGGAATSDELYAEIEGLAQAYEALQAQNTRLAGQAAEAQRNNQELFTLRLEKRKLSDKLKELVPATERLRADYGEQHGKLAEAGAQQRATIAKLHEERENLGKQVRLLEERHKKLQEQLRQREGELERQQRELQAHQQKIAAFEQRIFTEPGEFSALRRRVEELQAALEKAQAAPQVERGAGGTKGQLKMMESLLTDLEKATNCSICNSNFRDTAIKLCGHVFCSPCISDCLRARNRRCPECKRPFAQEDLLTLFLKYEAK